MAGWTASLSCSMISSSSLSPAPALLILFFSEDTTYNKSILWETLLQRCMLACQAKRKMFKHSFNQYHHIYQRKNTWFNIWPALLFFGDSIDLKGCLFCKMIGCWWIVAEADPDWSSPPVSSFLEFPACSSYQKCIVL